MYIQIYIYIYIYSDIILVLSSATTIIVGRPGQGGASASLGTPTGLTSWDGAHNVMPPI